MRLDAVKEMLRSLDEATIALLRERSGGETDAGVKYEIETGPGAGRARRRGRGRRGSRRSRRLRTGSGRRCGTGWRRCSKSLPTAASSKPTTRCGGPPPTAVQRIDQSRTFYAGIETLFFGLSLGSVLVLVAIGLAITFGVMGVINMAHGELMMLGAYTTYVVQLLMPQHIGRVDSGGDSGGVSRGRRWRAS